MLALSTGTARDAADPDYIDPSGYDAGYACGTPAGFPMETPACPGVITGQAHDGIALKLDISVPPGANGFSFKMKLYTYEFPQYICSTYIDFFVVILDPAPVNSISGYIGFDAQGNPISVNSSLIEVCNGPITTGVKTYPCPLGTADLAGTGFESHGATDWIDVQAPVTPGSTISILFATWDSGDGILDTTTLIDDWAWLSD
jgi:hypothetical protein